MNLLIDLGNSRLKWGISHKLDIISSNALLNADITREVLTNAWQTLQAPERIGIACVGSNKVLAEVISVADELWPDTPVSQAKSKVNQWGVSNAYLEPEKLGVDRWLAMLAGYHFYRKPLCIVDAGTAITVDVIDETGKHLGGLISPGLQLMKNALANGTANLKITENNHPFGLANITEAAINNGTLASACGLLELVLKNSTKDLQIVLTGGDCGIIATHLFLYLSRPAITETDLVLKGLALTFMDQP